MITLEHKKLHASQLSELYHFFEEQNEEVYKEQVLDYTEKYRDGFVHICFCGHFSAGKSTLINRMMEQELLPQSPIPTSANIVEIKNGAEKAIIHFTNKESIQFETLPETEKLHALCQDGEEINKIDLYQNIKNMDNRVVIMDTPGIDAADDADRLMTESAIHKVDLFVYVMDYNHVQSEVNALFLKQLEQRNKPFLVVVNQVDKHNEEEIAFQAFKQSLIDVFHTWDIHPTDYFFTSIKEDKAPINEFSRLKQTISSFGNELRNDLFNQSLYQSIQFSVKQSMLKKEQAISAKQRLLYQEMNKMTIPEDLTKEEVEKQLEEVSSIIENLDKQYEGVISPSIKNAQIMTFEHRERAAKLIESMQPSFKAGFFASKKRTEMERDNRLHQLYNELQVSVSEQLEWRLREKATAFISEYYPIAVNDQLFPKLVTKEDMKNLVDSAASYSDEYTLVYSDKLASFIRKQYRHYFLNIWQEVRGNALKPLEKQRNEWKQLYDLLVEKENLQNQINTLDRELESYHDNLNKVFETEHASINESVLLENILQFSKKKQLGTEASLPISQDTKQKKLVTLDTAIKEDANSLSYEQTLKHVDEALNLLEPVSSLTDIRKDLSEKKNRLKNRHYTVALFGAFSAGKSSFANLLIGERLLPVSPNPTTAAINKISPPMNEFSHGDVYVTLKSEDDLLNDMKFITEQEFTSLSECYQWVEKAKLQKLDLEEQHLSFILAFRNGYQTMKGKIGESFLIDFSEFNDYVQQEEKACFVQEIEVFYDCELTRSNITLVDTPGADSVNARHTDLAFSYIKDADAVLFVTYYNHPFSKPDQQFLERLGSVKDAFQLDKMFFIINAVDLANSDNEVELVQDYIQTELQTFQISEPRLYPLSSKEAFTKKKQGNIDERFQLFEEDFYHFIQEELTQISMQAVYHDIKRSYSYITHLLEMLNSDEETKEQQRQKFNQYEDRLIELSEQTDDSLYFERIVQRLQKQRHFMNQRFHIQFGDMFKSVIHPGSISTNGKAGRDELKKSLYFLNRTIHEKMTSELKALHIRIEQEINEAFKHMYEVLNKGVGEEVNDFLFSPIEFFAIEPKNDLNDGIELEEEEILKLSQLFKDTKSFFAEGRRDELQESVYRIVSKRWENTANDVYSEFQTHYKEEWQQRNREWKLKRKQEITSHYNLLRESLEVDQSDKQTYEKIFQSLSNLVQ